MGYYTYYSLTWEPDEGTYFSKEREIAMNQRFCELFYKESLEEVKKEFYGKTVEEPETWIDNTLNEECKWYDYFSDMSILSGEFPEVKFTIYGDGEDSDDKWVAYFYGGKGEFAQAEIVYADTSLW